VVSLALPPGVVTVWPYRVKPFFFVCVCVLGTKGYVVVVVVVVVVVCVVGGLNLCG
jgi:hypothetical protein